MQQPIRLRLFLLAVLVGLTLYRNGIDLTDLVKPQPPSPVKVTQDSLVVVREFSDTPESEVIRDLASTGEVRKWLEAHKVRFRLVDPDQETENGDEWVHQAMQVYKDKGEGKLPWMIFMDSDNRFLVGDVPQKRADFKNALGGYVNAPTD